MSILTSILPGWHGATIYADDKGQEVLGPSFAEIVVQDEPDLSPFPYLKLTVALRQGRYEITDFRAQTGDDSSVTVRGLQKLRLPEIVRRALLPEVTVRRTTGYGATTTGVSRDDEVPLVYLLARAVGEHPTKAVAEAFGLSSGAAAQRVARARRADPPLIPPTTKGAR